MKPGKYFLILFTISLLIPCPTYAGKPLPPLQIQIEPVSSGISSDQIRPGDTVQLKVTAVSLIDVQTLRIDVILSGGAKLVSGELSWNGPAAKNEEKSILVTVQAPEQGKGRIKAKVSIPSSDGTRFSAEAQFLLGVETKTKPEKGQRVKKDRQGRSIVEYR